MASTYSSDLKLELMATGENAGTWGTKTNTNLQLVQQAIGGFEQVTVGDGATVALAMTDGTISNARNMVVKVATVTLSGATVLTVPDSIEKMYIFDVTGVTNPTNLTIKTASGTGFSPDQAKIYFAYADGTNIVEVSLDSLGGAVGSASLPTVPVTKGGTGLTALGSANLPLKVNSGASALEFGALAVAGGGTGLTSLGSANQGITVNSGATALEFSTVKKAGKESIWVPALAMYPNTTNGCAAHAQVELSNGPEIKTLDFDKDSDEFAQFAVAFPKSWNESTVTFQAFFTADSTNTGTVSWNLAGVAFADNDSINTAFGTGVAPTAKAHSGTANDLDVTAESGAITIAGSPSTDEEVFFQIQRDVSEDSLTADAKLLGIKIFFTTDAANDA